MRLATRDDGQPDGRLTLVSADGALWTDAGAVAPTLQAAVERWEAIEPALRALAAELEEGTGKAAGDIRFCAPLPRAWQWLDGSAYESHGALMDQVFGIKPEKTGLPLMYQGLSHLFFGPTDDVPLPDEAHGIDFEGEFGIITDAVPMGVSAADALDHVKLVVQINDWSLRMLAGPEMKTGFGWIQAKPACSMAPFAVTPDALGEAWRDGRVCLDLLVDWNGRRFGAPNGAPMAFGFHDLIAHAARTRALPAGTIIGSGTVSNENYREIGSACIAERRGIEIVDRGSPITKFMHFGDKVKMEARTANGWSPFGWIDQQVVQSRRPG